MWLTYHNNNSVDLLDLCLDTFNKATFKNKNNQLCSKIYIIVRLYLLDFIINIKVER